MRKGERTATRILDAAETLFATQGYEGTTLRQIAAVVKLKEPGLYNHFSSKHALYEAVLHRALNPMARAMGTHLDQAAGLRDYIDLPSLMTDLLFEHPQIAALLQQAMHSDNSSAGHQLVQGWLNRLFKQGLQRMVESQPPGQQDPAALAIDVIALFNITTGYFLAQRAFESMTGGDLQDPANIARQKDLLHRVIRGILIH